jgi:hypothetical protein
MWEDPANAKGRGPKTEKILSWPSQFYHGICIEGANQEDAMRDKASDIRKLEVEAARMLKRRQSHDARGRQLAKAEKNYQEAIETVILSTIRAAGLTKLPLSELLNNIRALGQAAGIGGVGESAPNNEDDRRAPHPQSGGSEPEADVDRGGCEVFVKLSSNTTAANREVLEKSGVRWNGRLGGWKGIISIAAIEILRERFGDRLSILSAPTTTSKGSPSEGPPEVNPITPPANRPSAGPAGDTIEMGSLAEPDAGGDAMGGPAVSDEARLASSPLPPRPWALPKSPFARRPQVNE